MSQNNSFIIFTFTFFISTLICSGQQKDTKPVVNEWIGKKIQLPKLNSIKKNEEISINPLNKKIKILALINGECGVCMDELEKWKKYMNKVDILEVGFIFLIYYSSYMDNNYLDSSGLQFDYPYFEDFGQKYIIENKFPREKQYQTFLLNKSNKVILIGNPIVNESISNLFLKTIEKEITTNFGLERKETTIKISSYRIKLNVNDIIFKNENGDILSKEEKKKMIDSGKYVARIDDKTKIITLIKR